MGDTEGSSQSLMLEIEKRVYFGRYLEFRTDKIDDKLDVAIGYWAWIDADAFKEHRYIERVLITSDALYLREQWTI